MTGRTKGAAIKNPAPDSSWLRFDSGLGPILLQADRCGLTRIVLPGSGHAMEAEGARAGADHPLMAEAARQIREYLAGARTVFTLPISPCGTPFQMRVWGLIGAIPWGRTMTYGAIALLLGNRGLARAVGGAAHANPLPLVIPCHRVIGASGQLTGFACGLALKEKLLRLEGSLPDISRHE